MTKDQNLDLNGPDEDTEAKRLTHVMNAKMEENHGMDDAPLPEGAPERNVPSAKDWVEDCHFVVSVILTAPKNSDCYLALKDLNEYIASLFPIIKKVCLEQQDAARNKEVRVKGPWGRYGK